LGRSDSSAGVGTKAPRLIAPRRTRTQGAKEAVEDEVVHTRHFARPVRKHRLDVTPFVVAELAPYDSSLQFESLNHVHAGALNTDSPRPVADNVLWTIAAENVG
jgi:hypothetical protein